MAHHHSHSIKMVGANGQLSLGKAFAGKMVLIDRIDEGTWIIKAGTFIPDTERWLYQENNLASLEKALAWAEKHASEDNFEQLVQKIEHGKD